MSSFNKFHFYPCLFPVFRNFHVLNLNYENFKLYLQNTLNMLKTTMVYFGVLQAPHLVPTFRKDGDKFSSSALLYEVEVDLKVARKECDILKLKLQQSEESKSILKREALCYQVAFVLYLGIIVYLSNIYWDRMYLWNRM